MAEYTTKQVIDKTGVSKSTLVRWEKAGVFPKPKRRARTKARIWTDEHIQKIVAYRDKEEEPPPEPEAPRPKR